MLQYKLFFMLIVKNLIVLKKILKDEVDEICFEVIDNEEVNMMELIFIVDEPRIRIWRHDSIDLLLSSSLRIHIEITTITKLCS